MTMETNICDVKTTILERGAPQLSQSPLAFGPRGLLGRVLGGRYLLVDLLGTGGMGAVYGGIQTSIHREVAVKVLMPKQAHDESLPQRFKLEAHAVSKLNHPNTIRVFEYGEDGNLLYIVMEYLRGETLSSLLHRQGPLNPLRVAKITCQILSSLEEAHAKGIVHRDIKPGNIILQQIGRETDLVKVIDFGVAKLQNQVGGAALTQVGIVYGSPRYMSPEQISSEALDGRSDLYSVGILMWELLMGQTPFGGDDVYGILSAHLSNPPPRFRDVRPDLPVSTELEAIVGRALAKRREERFSSATSFRRALESFIATQASSSNGIYSTQSSRPEKRRNILHWRSELEAHIQNTGERPEMMTRIRPQDGATVRIDTPQHQISVSPPTWTIDATQLNLSTRQSTQMLCRRHGMRAATLTLTLCLLLVIGFFWLVYFGSFLQPS